MRVTVLKNMREKYIHLISEILAYEDKYGSMSYYSKMSGNGIAWKLENLPMEISRGEVNYLIKKGIIKRVKEGVYHINPELREKIREELKEVGAEIKSEVNIDNAVKYSIHGDADARALLNLLKFNRRWVSMYDDAGWNLGKAKEILISSGADLGLLNRLRESGMVYEVGDDEYLLRDFDETILNPYLESGFSTQDAIFEYMNVVVPMKRQFEEFVASLTEEDIDEVKGQIRDVWDVANYTKHVMEDMYMDVLLPIIQQYGMVDLPIYSSEGRKITQTGFSLAYFGEPGTGKTFATDDFIRGNERNGIPPHGIIGRVRYAEGMTPKKLIAILEAYQNYPVDWVIPEFNDFFRYRGMVEKLKLVMEQREVSDETKKEVIKPYKVTSFFIVNYNTHVSKGKWRTTIDDPNFNAIEDRMICKIFVNDEEREKAIYRNMVRRISGDIDWYLSDYLRKHLTYSYYVYMNSGVRLILDTSDFVEFGNTIRRIRESYGVSISNRIILKGVQIAGSAAIVKGLNSGADDIKISREELSLARKFIEDEIKTRSMGV